MAVEEVGVPKPRARLYGLLVGYMHGHIANDDVLDAGSSVGCEIFCSLEQRGHRDFLAAGPVGGRYAHGMVDIRLASSLEVENGGIAPLSDWCEDFPWSHRILLGYE